MVYGYVSGSYICRWILLILTILPSIHGGVFYPEDVPGVPTSLVVLPANQSSVRVQVQPPNGIKPYGSNGDPILGYKIDVAARVPHVQTFSIQSADGPITGGTYQLSFTNSFGTSSSTSCIPWDANSDVFSMALRSLSNIDGVSVSRSSFGVVPQGYVYTITFNGDTMTNGPQNQLISGSAATCTPFAPSTHRVSLSGAHVTTGSTGYQPEIWQLTTSETSMLKEIGGTFDLSIGFEGVMVSLGKSVSVNAGSKFATTTVANSLIGIVSRGDIVVIAGERFRIHPTAPFTDTVVPLDSKHIRGANNVLVYGHDTMVGRVSVVQTSSTVTTAADYSASLQTGDLIQIASLEFSVNAITTLSITLGLVSDPTTLATWPSSSDSHVTLMKRKKATFSVDVDPSELSLTLQQLPGVGSVQASRIGPTQQLGYQWLITFTSLGPMSCPQSPCLRLDLHLVDGVGAACPTCTMSIVRKSLTVGVLPDYTTISSSTEISDSVYEVQSITTSAPSGPIGGYFYVNFQVYYTSPTSPGVLLKFESTAEDVKAKLESIPTIGTVDVSRASVGNGYTWYITFVSNMGDLPSMTVDYTLLTGTNAIVSVAEVTKGIASRFEAVLNGLPSNVPLHVRAFAKNAKGYSAGSDIMQQYGRGALPLMTRLLNPPAAPTISNIWPVSFSQLGVQFTSPDAGGGAIKSYRLEATLDSAFGVSQVIAVDVNSVEPFDVYGTFQLKYGSQKTQLLTIDASATTMQAAINNLINIRPVTVTRALYVLTGDPLSKVASYSASLKTLTCTALTSHHARVLIGGASILVNQISFTISAAPRSGDTTISVTPADPLTASFNGAYSLLVTDIGGSFSGPFGYRWLITFSEEPYGIDMVSSQRWAISSSLMSVAESGALITSYALNPVVASVAPAHYTMQELSTEPWCNSYVVGSPSRMQIIEFSASTTITAGSYKLTLDQQTTDCILYNAPASGSIGSLKTRLEALINVNTVSVEESTKYKSILLSGTATNKVTAYNSVSGQLTIVSTDSPGLTLAEAAALSQGTKIRVSRSPWNIYQDYCDFSVTTSAAQNALQISVTLVYPTTCPSFTNEARILSIFDMKTYRVVFHGDYPTGQWPTLRVTNFGTGTCTAFTPSIPIKRRVKNIKYEGACAMGNPEVQTLIADADSTMGGTFSLLYRGRQSPSLSVSTVSINDITAAIQNLVPPTTSIKVTTMQHNSFGRAWQITFFPTEDPIDIIVINDSFLTGLNAEMQRYPAVEFESTSEQNSLRGTFSIALGGESTGPLGCAATFGKVIEALQSLNTVYTVMPVGNVASDPNQIGFTQLSISVTATANSNTLGNVLFQGAPIDPSLYVAAGDSITVGGESHTVAAVSTGDITLVSTMVAGGSKSASVGMLLTSTKAAPGVVSTITPIATVVTATVGSPTIVLLPGHGWLANDVVSIGLASFEVLSVNLDGLTVTLKSNYAGISVVSSSPTVNGFKNTLLTTSDLSPYISTGSKIWYTWADGTTSEFGVRTVSSRQITLTGVVKQAIFMGTIRINAGGYRYPIVFKSISSDLHTIDAYPHSDWSGYMARLKTLRPQMVQPFTFTLGNPSQIQTVKLSATNPASVGVDASYTLMFNGETTNSIPWGATSATIKTELGLLSVIDGVTVTSLPVGNGQIHSVTFWGTDYNIRTLPLMSSTVNAGTNGVPSQVSIVHHIMQPSYPFSPSFPYYSSLSGASPYTLRVVALNEMGHGLSSTLASASTAMAAVLPSPPRGVTLGNPHGQDWLGVTYKSPKYNGGAPIVMYRIEWDASSAFDSTGPDFHYEIVQKQFEVQEVVSSYRSSTGQGGTFTLSFGGFKTNPLSASCTAAQMSAELISITDNVKTEGTPVKVSRSSVGWGYSWKITFMANPGDLALLRVDYSMVQGDFPQFFVREKTKGVQNIVPGDFTYEVQDIYTTSASPLAGTFVLSFHGMFTAPISVDASALEMQDILEALSTIYSAKVTKTIVSSDLHTSIWSVTFAHVLNNVLVGSGNIFRMIVETKTFTSGTLGNVEVAEKVKGTNPYHFRITGLTMGVTYYVRVMAYNSQGFGSNSSPYAAGVPRAQPGPPSNVGVTVEDSTALKLTWSPPVSNGGAIVDRYKAEWFRVAGQPVEQTITTSATRGIQEVQQITSFSSTPSLGGNFKLTFNGYTTGNIAWNALATGIGSVKDKLERIPSIGSVIVTRSTSLKTVPGFYVILSTTTTATAQSPVNDVVNCCGFNIGDSLIIAGQTRTISGLTGATITLSAHAALTTVPIQVYRSANGYQWTITFGPMHVGDVAPLIVAPSDNWGGSSPGIYVSTLQGGVAPIGGSFRLKVPLFVNGLIMTEQTPPLPFNISDVALKGALESLSTVSVVDVRRTVNGYGYNWFVAFPSDTSTDVQLIIPDGEGLTGPNVAIAASITQPGTSPLGYCEANGVPTTCHTVSASNALSDIIPQLTTGVPYMARVRAHTSEGWGPASWSVPQYEIPRGIPLSPRNVQLMSLSSTQLKVVWSTPSATGGSPVTSYRIDWDTSSTFSTVGTPGFDSSRLYSVPSQNSGPYYFNIPIIITANYFVRVYAINDRGQSLPAFSVPSSVQPSNMPPGVPQSCTLEVLGSTGYLVQWQPPSSELTIFGGAGGIPITQYMVEWDLSSTFDSPASYAMVTGDQSQFVIGGRNVLTGEDLQVLIPGETYYVRITSFNGLGASPTTPTTPASLQLSNKLPWPPRELQLTDLSSTSVLAQWATPQFDGGMSLKNYLFQYDQQSDYMSGSMQSVNIPIVHEQQNIWLSTEPLSEEQNVEATVQVTNERQTVRTTVTGVDEIQIVTTSSDPVVDEIQTITTTATDRDEVQTLTLDATDINEIQAVRTNLVSADEVQTVTVGVSRVFEVQSFSIGFANIAAPSQITGSLTLGFDTIICAFCPIQMVSQTVDVTNALVDDDDISGGNKMVTLIGSLANVDSVTVTRTKTLDNVANTLTILFRITFSGLKVAGNVPAMTLQSGSLGPLIPLTSVPTTTTEDQVGSQPTYNAASYFKLYYTCEQYSDPTQKIGLFPGIRTNCEPTNQLCPSCATNFDGTDITVTADLTGLIANGAVIQIGPCVFGISGRTQTKLTVDTANVGKYCSHFSSKALPVYVARVFPSITNLVMTQGSGGTEAPTQDTIVAGQIVNTIGKTVSVQATPVITSLFVGTSYAITFSGSTGTIPLLTCDASSMVVTSGTRSCTVIRTTTGSMIYGTFTLSLSRVSDGQVFTTSPMPFDISEVDMKTQLQSVGSAAEWVFGTVSVTRNSYPVSGALRWCGGFTWQIQFQSRGWDIPTMTFDDSLLLNMRSALPLPVLQIEDGSNLLTPSAGSVHGNQVGGSFKLSYNGQQAGASCIIGVNTDNTHLTTGPTYPDTKLEDYLKAQFNFPSISVHRSLPTQAMGFTWYITFIDKDTGGDVPPLLVVAPPPLTGAGASLVNAELVRGNQISGTFRLQFNGQTTGPILYSATAPEVAEQINGLDSIRPSQVIVSRTGPYGPSTGVPNAGTQVLGYMWSITFRSSVWKDPTSEHTVYTPGNWVGPPATWTDTWETGYSKAWGRHVGALTTMGFQIACLPQGLITIDGGATCTAATVQHGVGPLRDTFRLELNSGLNPYMRQGVHQSIQITHNAWGSAVESRSSGTSMEEILEGMPNIGNVAVTRSVVNPLNGGYSWTITFLNDKEPCAEHDSLTGQCNSPGNVPLLTKFSNSLAAPNADVQIVPNTDGVILRNDFSVFKVNGDPGVEHRFILDLTCQGATGGSTCTNEVGSFIINTPSPALSNFLLAGDRFSLGGYSSCIFTVISVSSILIDVVDNLNCVPMRTVLTGGPFPLTIILPWNAQDNQVLRVIQAASDASLETGIWSGGRKVSVEKTVIGKYGAISWLIRFISNPGKTPPGAGNISPLDVQFLTPTMCTTCSVSVLETQAGSIPLSGDFTIDYHAVSGPRTVHFDSSADRLERMLNEMNTLGLVKVTKYKIPSIAVNCNSNTCAGGWDDVPVMNDGTRGGYRWKIRFLKNPGDYNGYTYPPGTGNMNALTLSFPDLLGSGKSVDVYTMQQGQAPLSGTFGLVYNGATSPPIAYASSAAILEQALETLPGISHVSTTQDVLSYYAIPGASASIQQDAMTATISGVDISQYFIPGDIIRFGAPIVGSLVGSNGDSPITGIIASSKVTVRGLSPIIVSDSALTSTLFPGHQLRLGGNIYTIGRTGIEIQKLTVSIPIASFTANIATLFFKISLQHKGTSATSAACLPIQMNNLATELNTLILQIDPTAGANSVSVTRSSLSESGGTSSYIYTIYFTGAASLGNIPQITTDKTVCPTLNGADAVPTTAIEGGRVARQSIMLSTDSGYIVDNNGYFALQLGGATTGCLKWGDSSDAIETALNAVLSDRVIVSRHGSGESITEIQKIIHTSNAQVVNGINGYFRIAFKNNGVTATTSCLNYGLSAIELQTALNGLSNVDSGHIVVTRTGDGTAAWGYGFEYQISFSGNLRVGISNVLGNVNQLVVYSIGKGSCSAAVTGIPSIQVQTIRSGQPGFTYEVFFVGNSFSYVAPLAVVQEATCTASWTAVGGSSRRIELQVVSTGASPEIQEIIIKDASAAIAGTPTFKISLLGATMGTCIAYNVAASAMQTALNGLVSGVGTQILVSDDIDPIRAPNGKIFRVTFIGDKVSGNIKAMTIVQAGCTAFAAVTSSAEVSTTQEGGGTLNEIVLASKYTGDVLGSLTAYSVAQSFRVLSEQYQIDQIIVSNPNSDILAGANTYTLTLAGTSTSVLWNALDTEMEYAFITGLGVPGVTVTRRADAAIAPGGFVYTVYYLQSIGSVGTLTKTSAFTSATVSVTNVRAGTNKNLLTSSIVPLASISDSNVPVSYIGGGNSLSVFKANGFQWSVLFDSNIGDVPALLFQSTAGSATTQVFDNFIQGSMSNTVTVSNLIPGIPYYMKVSAGTEIGQSPFTASAYIIPSSVPTPPQNLQVGYDLFVNEIQVVKTAARHVLEVQTVTTSAAVISEVQTITTSAGQCNNCITGNVAYRQPTVQVITLAADGPVLSGSFQLVFTDTSSSGTGSFTHTTYATAALIWGSTADEVAAALVLTTALQASDIIVTREGDASSNYNYGYIFSITFVGNSVAGEVLPLIIRDTTTATACGTCTAITTLGNVAYTLRQSQNLRSAMGTDTAVQRIVLKADRTLHTGGFKLSLNHAGATQTSICIPFNVGATDFETILQTMPNIDKVYVQVTEDSTLAPNGYVYDIFFYGQGVTRYPLNQMVVDLSGCTAFQTLVNNVLTTIGVVPSVVLTYVHRNSFADLSGFAATTSTSLQLQNDLIRLPIVSNGLYVSRSLKDNQGGYKWTIVFDQNDGNVPLFICASDTTFRAVQGALCVVESVIDGNTLSGSFILGSSDPIPYNADESTMARALQVLSWIGTVAVTRTGPTGQLGYTWTLSFLTYQGAMPVLLVTNLLNGIGSSVQVVETVRGNAISGTFQLTFRGRTTTPIAYNAPATIQGDGSSLQEKLQALPTIGALSISRIGPDFEGGYEWWITFTDDIMTGGDLPLLTSSNVQLGAVGAVVSIRKALKGSMGSGNRLWVSFDPPVSDNGDSISSYGVDWDTSNTFGASPQRYILPDPMQLYFRQKVITAASSIAWSSTVIPVQTAIQSIAIGTANGNTFTLSFRGITTGLITVGITPLIDVQTAVSNLYSITGGVTISPNTGLVTAGTSFGITFSGEYGPQPVLVSSDTNNIISTVRTGVTNFRKEVLAFTCTATAGTVTITAKALTRSFAFHALLSEVQTDLIALLNAQSGSITVTAPTQTFICSGTPETVKITFHRTYGPLGTGITGAGGATIALHAMSTAGIYESPTSSMSGTFQLMFQGANTPPVNSQSAAMDLRTALETIPTISTVSVTRSMSYQVLQGKVDVQKGQLYVTCSSGETCNFNTQRYGIPGIPIYIGGTWYTVLSDLVSPTMPTSQLFLGDMNNNPIAYQGETATGIGIYEWAKGYIWSVEMLLVSGNNPLTLLRPRQINLTPNDGKVVVQGESCKKCYYIPDETSAPSLTMGAEYFIRTDASNSNGKSPSSSTISAIPRQIPDAPNAVNVVVVSGTQIEVFFSPPSLAPSRVSPTYNNDITAYMIQWDTVTSFKHGLPACVCCATGFTGTAVTVTTDLSTQLGTGKQITLGSMNCVLTITGITALLINVAPNSCTSFNIQTYDVLFYTYPPVVLSGLPVQGTPPYRYLIQSLTISTTYYIRIAAINSVPVQKVSVLGTPPDNRRWTFPTSVTTANVLPDPPLSAFLYVISGTSLELQIQPALRDGQGLGGAGVIAYSVDVDRVSTFDTPQRGYPIDVPIASFTLLFTGGPLTYYINGLATGTPYFVQVRAKTSVGYSRATIASNTLAPTCTSGSPTQVVLSTVSKLTTAPISTAMIRWDVPTALGGLPIRYYHVEWWTASSRPEVQVVELKWTQAPTSLTFTLAFGGSLTGSIPFDCSAANLRSALMNINGGGAPASSPVGHIEVTRTAINVNQGYQWSITFITLLRNLPMLQISIVASNGGTGIQNRVFESVPGVTGGTTTFPGTQEVQVLTLQHATPGQLITGFFRLSFMGSLWSTYIPTSASAGFLQNILQELPTVGQVTVTTLTNANFPTNMIAWKITFNSIVGNVPALAIDATKLQPSSSTATIYDGNNAVLANGAWCTALDLVCQAIYTHVRIGEQAVDYGFYDTNVPNVLTYTITGLTTGTPYYSSVTAQNALGLGSRGASFPASIIPPKQAPSKPTGVSVDVNFGISTQLIGSWSTPLSDGGEPIRKYTVEYATTPAFTSRASQDVWCSAANVHAVWRVTSSRINVGQTSPIGAGWFKLKLTRANSILTTDPIPFNAVAMGSQELGALPAFSLVYCTSCPTCTDVCDTTKQEQSGSLQNKLQALTNINGVTVTRSAQNTDGGYVWSITFNDIGDDFAFEAISSSQGLNCAGNTCANSDYRVAAVKVTSGVSYGACTGQKILPATGTLIKGTLYYVRVSAFNAIGYSLPQLAPNPQKPMVVPGLPSGVSLQVNSVSSLKVVFSPPVDNGGDTIDMYQVTWSIYPDFHASSTTQVTLLSGGAPFYCLIPGLTKGQYYYVQVAAHNSQGTGLPALSSPSSMNPHTVPSAPTAVVLGITSQSMITIGWKPPADDGGDNLSGYVVEWDTLASYNSLNLPPDKNRISISDVTQRAYTISLLTQFTAYYVRVFAVNSLGPGPGQDATPLPGIPDLVRPGKPVSVTATGVTTPVNKIYVQWQAPYIPDHGIPCFGSLASPIPCPEILQVSAVFGGVPLNNYVIEWSTSPIFPGTQTKVSQGNNIDLLASDGLVSGTTYYIRVQTVNQNGLVSVFCERLNANPYLCPDNLQLPDGSFSTGGYVTAIMP